MREDTTSKVRRLAAEYEGARSVLAAMRYEAHYHGFAPGSMAERVCDAAFAAVKKIEAEFREACRLRDLENDAVPEPDFPDY